MKSERGLQPTYNLSPALLSPPPPASSRLGHLSHHRSAVFMSPCAESRITLSASCSRLIARLICSLSRLQVYKRKMSGSEAKWTRK